MKKGIFILLMVALCAFSAFAIDMSVGGGIDFTHAWSLDHLKLDGNWSKSGEKANLIGINAFFDAQYIRAGLGISFTVGGMKIYYKDSEGNSSNTNIDKVSRSQFNLLVVGKYPFDLGMAKIYPMAGFDFSFNVIAKYDGKDAKQYMPDDMKKDLNHYYFVAGLGADIGITDNLYLTPTMLFGIDMKKTSSYADNKVAVDAAGTKYHSNNLMFNIGFGVGYKF